MDGEDKHDVCLEARPQEETFPTVAADCEVSTDNTTRCMTDYNMLNCLKPAHGRPDGTQADTVYSQQKDGIPGHMVKCLPSVKCEEHRLKLNEQSHVISSHSTL